jgi:hypothetical protein
MKQSGMAATKTKIRSRAVEKRSFEEAADKRLGPDRLSNS